MAGPLQAADDIIRTFMNGVTLGGADKLAAYMGEKDTAGKTAAARERAGVAGDLTHALGSVYGVGKGLKLGWAGLKTVPKIAGAVGAKKAGGAALLGLLGLGEYNARTAPAVAAKPQPAAQPAAKSSGSNTDPIPQMPKFDDSFEGLVARAEQANGGALNLPQLSALADMAGKVAATKKPLSIKDVAGQQALTLSKQILEQEAAAAEAAGDKKAYANALENHLQRIAPLYGGSASEYGLIDPQE